MRDEEQAHSHDRQFVIGNAQDMPESFGSFLSRLLKLFFRIEGRFDAGIKHLRSLMGSGNVAFSAAVSDFALIVLTAIELSLTNVAISPTSSEQAGGLVLLNAGG